MKAIKITQQNQSSIGQQFHVDALDYDDLVPIDYIIIADFGGEWIEGTCSLATFEEFFEKTGDIENEWFTIARKPAA